MRTIFRGGFCKEAVMALADYAQARPLILRATRHARITRLHRIHQNGNISTKALGAIKGLFFEQAEDLLLKAEKMERARNGF